MYHYCIIITYQYVYCTHVVHYTDKAWLNATGLNLVLKNLSQLLLSTDQA